MAGLAWMRFLPAALGYPGWVRRGMAVSIAEAGTFIIWFSTLGGNYLTGFALFLGAGGFELGLLGALPALAMSLQVLGAPLVRGLRARRLFLGTFAALQRLTWPLAGFLALVLPREQALPVYLALFMVSWVAVSPVVVVWQGYMSDLVPAEIRGRYFGLRQSVSQLAGMGAVLVVGRVLDRWPGAPGWQAVHAIGLAAALLNLVTWPLHPDVPPPPIARGRPFWASILAPLRLPGPHRTATLFFAAWGFAQGLAVPFFPVALLQARGLSFSAVSLLATLATLSTIMTSPFWGRLQDRRGVEQAGGVAAALLTVVPLLFVLARWTGWPALVLAHVLFGSAFGGMMLVMLSLNMKLAPAEDRAIFLAAFGALGGLAGFLAPLAAGPLTGRYLDGLFTASALASGALTLLWWAMQQRRT